MSRIWAACGILLVLILVCVGGLISTERTTEELKGQLEELQTLAEEEKMEEAIAKSRQIEENWHTAHEFLSTYIEHSRLEQIDQSVAVLTVWLEQEDTAEFKSECRRALSQLTHLKDTEFPSFGNLL